MYAIRSYYENGKGANGNTGTDESINNKPEPSTNHSEVFSSNNPKHNEDLGKLRRASSYNVSGTIALTNPLGYKLNRVETNILCYGTTQSIIAQKSTIHNITVITSYSIHYTKLYDTARSPVATTRRPASAIRPTRPSAASCSDRTPTRSGRAATGSAPTTS